MANYSYRYSLTRKAKSVSVTIQVQMAVLCGLVCLRACSFTSGAIQVSRSPLPTSLLEHLSVCQDFHPPTQKTTPMSNPCSGASFGRATTTCVVLPSCLHRLANVVPLTFNDTILSFIGGKQPPDAARAVFMCQTQLPRGAYNLASACEMWKSASNSNTDAQCLLSFWGC